MVPAPMHKATEAVPLLANVSLPEAVMALAVSFAHLPRDPWCAHRNRRFSQFRVSATHNHWDFNKLPHRPHIQYPENNRAMGGILRDLAPLEIQADVILEFACGAFNLDPNKQWHMDLHQWRMNCTANTSVACVPEGRHQDGHRFVGIFVVERHAVNGGMTTVYDRSGKAITELLISPGNGILLDDKHYLHATSEITAASENGYRDIFVVCINPWEAKKYGAAFESACRGELAREQP